MQPDQFGIDDSITGQFRSVDEGVEEFLDLTRRIDVLKRYSNTGKLPSNMDAYGGLNLDSIFSGALGEIEMDMRVSVSMSRLYGEDSLGYLSGLQADSAAAYGEEVVETTAESLQPRTQAHISSDQYKFTGSDQYLHDQKAYKQELERISNKSFENMTKEEDIIFNRTDSTTVRLRAEIQQEATENAIIRQKKIAERAAQTALANAKRKTNLSVGTVVNTPETVVPVGGTVKDKLASIQALKNAAKTPIAMTDTEIRLEAAKAKGRAMGPVDDLIDVDDLIGSGSFDDEIDYADDAYRGMINTKPIAVGPGSSARATSTAVTTTSRSSTTKNIIKGVETATDLVSSKSKINLKAAFAASTLGLAGGYMTNRNRTRR